MPLPTGNISNNRAEIYAASLMYEGMGKCGDSVDYQTIILGPTEEWNHAVDGGAKVWKIVCLVDLGMLGGFSADNYDATSEGNLVGAIFNQGMEVMAGGDKPGSGITLVSIEEGVWILYKDCPQS